MGKDGVLLLDLGHAEHQVVGLEFMAQTDELLADVAVADHPLGADALPGSRLLGHQQDELAHLVHLLRDGVHPAGRCLGQKIQVHDVQKTERQAGLLGQGDGFGDRRLAGRSTSNGAYDSRHASLLQLAPNPTGLGSLRINLTSGIGTFLVPTHPG